MKAEEASVIAGLFYETYEYNIYGRRNFRKGGVLLGKNRAERRTQLRQMFRELMADKYSPQNCKHLSRKQRREAARFEAKVAQKAFERYLEAQKQQNSSSGSAKATLVKAVDLQKQQEAQSEATE